MNWLAHLYLSEPDAPFKIGNLLPDLASGADLSDLPEPFQRGIRCHREIDVFTDGHPRFLSCVRRFPPPYRRYGGVLTDIYFDHILARDWSDYSAVSLSQFLDDFYRDIETCLPSIPPDACSRLRRMRDEHWLETYHTLSGITDILSRVSRRFRRPFDLTGSKLAFQEQESDFVVDFRAFFPELVAHVREETNLGLVHSAAGED